MTAYMERVIYPDFNPKKNEEFLKEAVARRIADHLSEHPIAIKFSYRRLPRDRRQEINDEQVVNYEYRLEITRVRTLDDVAYRMERSVPIAPQVIRIPPPPLWQQIKTALRNELRAVTSPLVYDGPRG